MRRKGSNVPGYGFDPLPGFCRCFLPACRASRVRPSTPPRFHKVLRQSFFGHRGGSSISGIHRWPQTSQTATLIIFQPMATAY